MATDVRRMARFAGIAAFTAGIVAIIGVATQYARHGVLDWFEVVLALVFLGAGVFWWLSGRVPDGRLRGEERGPGGRVGG